MEGSSWFGKTQAGPRPERRMRFRRRDISMRTFGVLAALTALCVIWPAVSSAAECTINWTGPAKGTWQTAGNWSTGKVPTSTDVACIESGKTAQVTSGSQKAALVQGEGALEITASLELSLPPAEGSSSIASLSIVLPEDA